MSKLIHQDTHDLKLGPRWMVERPYDQLPNLVRFQKMGRDRKLLDQIAHWDGSGWSAKRWRPNPRQVPHTLLAIVENHLRAELEVRA
jgi:hypothetical protein